MPKYSKPNIELVQNIISNKQAIIHDEYHTGNQLGTNFDTDNNNISYLIEDRTINFDRWSLGQLMTRCKVPLKFYDRCSPSLQHEIFREHCRHFNHNWLIRFSLDKTLEEYGNEDIWQIRAMLSSRYEVVNDYNLIPAILNMIQNQENSIDIQSLEYDTHITRLILELPQTRSSSERHNFVAGIQVVNSETGHSAIYIEPVILYSTPDYSYSYFNRRAISENVSDSFRIVHSGNITTDTIGKLLAKAQNVAQVGIIQLLESQNNRIDGTKALEFAKKIETLPTRLYNILEEEWSQIEDISKFDIATRIILVARELPLFQRLQTESAATAITGIFKNYQIRMNEILEEMQNE